MASNKFKNVPVQKTLDRVAEESKAKARVVVENMTISNDKLFDFANNCEDIENTADLELSIKENGFRGVIEVTNFGMKKGEYTIVSGHRRRSAGVKLGMKEFPCKVLEFNNELDLENYNQMANGSRNAIADPLLLCRRYKRHEELQIKLNERNGEKMSKGDLNKRIATRLGISPQQAERYKAFNKAIKPYWTLVEEEKAPLSGLLKVAVLSEEQQQEVFKIFEDALKEEERLSRERCIEITDAYTKNNIRTYADFLKKDEVQEDEIPVNPYVDGDGMKYDTIIDNVIPLTPKSEKDSSPLDRNDEVRREEDYTEEEQAPSYKDEELDSDDYEVINNNSKHEENVKKAKELDEKVKNAHTLMNLADECEKVFNSHYEFENKEDVALTVKNLTGLVDYTMGMLEHLCNSYDLKEQYAESITKLSEVFSVQAKEIK